MALYAEAASHNGDADLTEKLANARLMCLEATPTPTAPISPAEGISGTLPTGPDGQGNGDG